MRGSRILTLSLALALAACSDSLVEIPPEPEVPREVPRVLALAGADLEVLEGSRVQLDGHTSRALADPEALQLTWSQVGGPSVLLTNPSAAAPAFVAPTAPAELVFQLRASAGDAEEALDQVIVKVVEGGLRPPFYLEGPPDVEVQPGERVLFTVEPFGAARDDVTVRARAFCDTNVDPVVNGREVSIDAPESLPCAVLLDAELDGRRSATVARVLWPEGTPAVSSLRLERPVVVEPGQDFVVGLSSRTEEAALVAWPAGGDDRALAAAARGSLVSISAPLVAGRLFFGSEARVGAVSSGVKFFAIDVNEGKANRAPQASGGLDRKVAPGGAFRIDTSGSSDPDGDPLTVRVEQVLGAQAEPGDDPDVFTAPDSPGVLLFHVIAHDERVFSSPVSVRVDVEEDLENLPPVVDVQGERFVTPGSNFTLSLEGAVDPDSGFIDRYRISQDSADDVILLDEPVDEFEKTLTAGAAGDVYHFRLSAFDEQGLQGQADVTVTVELAGPYVDFSRGFEDGDGTDARPFLNLTDAIVVAERHQLPELRLGAGVQLPFAGDLPPGLDLHGGWAFTDGAWAESATRTELHVSTGGIGVDGGQLRFIDLVLDAPDAILRLSADAALTDSGVTEGPLHVGAMVTTTEGATASLTRVTALSVAPVEDGSEVPALVAVADSQLRVEESVVTAGPGGVRVGVLCDGAVLDVRDSEVSGGSQATESIGIDADDCDLQIIGSRVASGDGALAVALDAQESALLVDSESTIEALAATATTAVGVRFESVAASGTLAGSVQAGDALSPAGTASGVLALSSRLQLDTLDVVARGADRAEGVVLGGDQLTLREVDVDVDGLESSGLVLEDVSAASLLGGVISASGGSARGVELRASTGARLVDLTLTATGTVDATAVAGSNAVSTTLERVDARAVAPIATGVIVRGATLTDARADAAGDEAHGLRMVDPDEAAILIRVRALARGVTTGTGAVIDGPLDAQAVFVLARGASAVGLETRAPATLVHVTALSDGSGLRAGGSGATLDVVNSAVSGAQVAWEIAPGAPAFSSATGVAFEGAALIRDEQGDVTDPGLLGGLGCVGCLAAAVSALVDEEGLLVDGANDLVDRGDLAQTLDFDLDGGARPLGNAPDLGADERDE
jgi:hypothetical protein